MTRVRWLGVVAIVVASLGAERFIHHEYDYWFTGIPGFFVLFGFVGCVAIIYLSKWFGRLAVQRDEDYYDRHGDDDPHQAMSGTHFVEPSADTEWQPRLHAPAPPREEG